jgi:hypothetical protein
MRAATAMQATPTMIHHHRFDDQDPPLDDDGGGTAGVRLLAGGRKRWAGRAGAGAGVVP